MALDGVDGAVGRDEVEGRGAGGCRTRRKSGEPGAHGDRDEQPAHRCILSAPAGRVKRNEERGLTPFLRQRSEPAISAASCATSVGVRPTRTPRASSASCLATAVPAVPETIAPAWPIVLPGGAVKPAM